MTVGERSRCTPQARSLHDPVPWRKLRQLHPGGAHQLRRPLQALAEARMPPDRCEGHALQVGPALLRRVFLEGILLEGTLLFFALPGLIV